MWGTYIMQLIILSMIISIFATYALFDTHDRTLSNLGPIRLGWRIGGALVIGIGLWSAQLIAMPSHWLPKPGDLDISLIAVSTILLILAYTGDRHLARKTRMLIESEQRHKSVIEHNTALICSLDADGRILSINPSAVLITGFYERELIGQTFWTLFSGPEQNRVEQFVQSPSHFENPAFSATMIHKLGHDIQIGFKRAPIVVNGRSLGQYIIGRDITEFRRAEEMIQRLRYQQDLILNAAGEGIYGLDQHGHITFCNPASVQMTGYTISESMDQPYHALIHHTREDGTPCAINECPIHASIMDGVVHQVAIDVFWRKDGTCFPVEYVSTPIFEADQIVGAVVVFKDVTERVKNEELLRKSDRLAVAGQLAAGVAHEIRNPLTALKGFVQLMSSGSDKTRYLEIMSSELNRIEDIITEFLLFTKPQSVHFEHQDVRALLQHVITLVEVEAKMNNVHFVTQFEADLPAILCAENQLKQVFINILRNALDAMPLGGDIVIEVRRADQDGLLIRFIDQGCGIPPERLAKLGEPFYTTKERGTGLGLMMSYKIIEDHHGNISISSEQHHGTTVEIFLPVAS